MCLDLWLILCLAKAFLSLENIYIAGSMGIPFKCELYIFRVCSLKYLKEHGWDGYYLLLDAAGTLFQLILKCGQSSRSVTGL